jgi:superfamily II DNA or RNA helicase
MSTAHPQLGSFAAEHLSPAYPSRAPWGTAENLRAWQSEALAKYFEREPQDFLAAATPGAGKTTFALRLASELLRRKAIDRITVVTPTEHLKNQWADAAHRVGIKLNPSFSNSERRHSPQFDGVVVTYAQVATKAHVHKSLTESARTLVIMDEVHHGGDAQSWGEAMREAFGDATRRLSLTGTPFRSDHSPIPFVTYSPDSSGIMVSQTDYDYGYGRALKDGVVRPVMFMVYSGQMQWVTRSGMDMNARLGQDNTSDVTAQAWRAALDPQGKWIPDVLHAAHYRLKEVRKTIPDAAGLVIASDKNDARAYARVLHELTGVRPVVVLSDESGSSRRIEEFSHSSEMWMVAVRMVSEGVDVPRLAVGVYATNASTPLYFAQAIGRFVRARRRGETASVFLPNVPSLTEFASELERQRDHALEYRRLEDADSEFFDAPVERNADSDDKESTEESGEYVFISSDATFDKVVYQSEDFGAYAEPGSPEELDFIGIPGILDTEQISQLLRHRHRRQSQRMTSRSSDVVPARSQPLHRTLREQRTLLNSLVALWSRQTDTPHGVIHAELRSTCGGPAVGQATVSQLQARIDLLRKRISSPQR